MKKKIVISIILIIFIFFVSSICKSNAEATYSQFKEIQHILNIDTDLNDSVFDKKWNTNLWMEISNRKK